MKHNKQLLTLALLAASAFSAQAKDDVHVYLNQVGYYPDEEKVVVVEGINAKEKMQVHLRS